MQACLLLVVYILRDGIHKRPVEHLHAPKHRENNTLTTWIFRVFRANYPLHESYTAFKGRSMKKLRKKYS